MSPETKIYMKLLITRMCNHVKELRGNVDLVALMGGKTKFKGVFNVGIHSNVIILMYRNVDWYNLVESGPVGDQYTKP